MNKSFASIDEMLAKIKKKLDIPPKKANRIKVFTLFGCNATGKTRLSKSLYDQYEKQVLYYNAFTEDLFSWDNNDYVLKIDTKAWIFQTIIEQELDGHIISNFQRFTGSKLEPVFDFSREQVTFGVYTGDDKKIENIKISRGEESVFVWSVFYTVLDAIIGTLSLVPDNQPTTDFRRFQYVVIDDPVSSMDDTRIITIALELMELISKSPIQLKFMITTHHALFFNVLFHFPKNKLEKRNFIISKKGSRIHLESQSEDSPFAYHHMIILEIQEAITKNSLKKYHFNQFRTLLEKTANFLGYKNGWKNLLSESESGKEFIKTIDQYSHDRLSELEIKKITEESSNDFKRVFYTFLNDFKWGVTVNG